MIHETVWQTYLEVGSAAIQAGRLEIADEMLGSALELARSSGNDGVQTAQKLVVLARLYQAHKRVRRALAILKEALSIFKRVLGLGHPNTMATLEGIAQIYVGHGKLNKAAVYYELAARVDEMSVKDEFRPIVVRMLTKLAWIYYTQGRFADSEMLYRRVESIPVQEAPILSDIGWSASTTSEEG